MKRRFTLRWAVAHKAICFDIGCRRAIQDRHRSPNNPLYKLVVGRAISLAKSCVEGRCLFVWLMMVDISTLLNKKLAKLPVTVKHRSI